MTLNEIIECIKEVKEDYWEDDGYGYATADCQRITTALDETIERLEQTGWIPISERLPEESKRYVVATKYNDVMTDFYTGERFLQGDDIIAWMLLPEPYKAESENKE